METNAVQFLSSFKLAKTHTVNRQASEQENLSQLNLIPNIQAIDVHPIYPEIVAVASQQTIQIYDFSHHPNDQLVNSFDLQEYLVVQAVHFTSPHQYECRLNDRRIRIVDKTLQLIVQFKHQRFLHIIDYLSNRVTKLDFQEPVVQVFVPRALQNVTLDVPWRVSEEFYQNIRIEDCAKDVPKQYFACLTQSTLQSELIIVTCNYNQAKRAYTYHQCIAQLPLCGQTDDQVQPSLTQDSNNDFFVLQNKMLYKFRPTISKKQKESDYRQQMVQICREKMTQYQNDVEGFANATFRLRTFDQVVDKINLITQYNFEGQIKANDQTHQIVFNKGTFYILADSGVYAIRKSQEAGKLGGVRALFRFNNQQKVIVNFKLNLEAEHAGPVVQAEASRDSSCTSSSFDIFSAVSSSSQSNSSILSFDEETSSMDQLNELQARNEQLQGFDYFVYHSKIQFENLQQQFQLNKLIKSNFQLIQTFRSIYELALEKQCAEGSIEIQNQFINFGQRIVFSNNNHYMLCFCNPLVNLSVFDITQTAGAGNGRCIDNVGQFGLFNENEVKVSRNAMSFMGSEVRPETFLWAKGNNLMVMQSCQE